MVFGGSDAPTALGCMYSLGAINMENNGKVQAGVVTDILEKYGVTENYPTQRLASVRRLKLIYEA